MLYAKPVYEPDEREPFQWLCFDGVDGGTFAANCRDEKAVRAAMARGIPHVEAVNYLRSIPLRIDPHVLPVVKAPEARGLLKKVKENNDSAATLLEQNIKMADRFLWKRLYIPLRVDFRGRLIAGPNL